MRNVRFFSAFLTFTIFMNIPAQENLNDIFTWRNTAGFMGALVTFYIMSTLIEKPKTESDEKNHLQLQAPENNQDSKAKKNNSNPWIDHDHPFLKPEVFLPLILGSFIMHYFFGNYFYRIIYDNLFK